MKELHIGAKWLFRFRGYGTIFFLLLFLGIFVAPMGIPTLVFLMGDSLTTLITTFVIGFIILVVLTIIFSEIYAGLAYKNWRYEIGHDNVRLERGIIWKKYSNIPYERVQNIDIQRGIIARMFGFSTLHIQTAGYSAPVRGYGAHAEGYIPAIDPDEAERIREFILKKIQGKKSGL